MEKIGLDLGPVLREGIKIDVGWWKIGFAQGRAGRWDRSKKMTDGVRHYEGNPWSTTTRRE